jgi:hypothetical protein
MIETILAAFANLFGIPTTVGSETTQAPPDVPNACDGMTLGHESSGPQPSDCNRRYPTMFDGLAPGPGG